MLLSLRSCLRSICEGSANVEFFLAYAAHMQALQSSSEADTQALQSSEADPTLQSSEADATLQSSEADATLQSSSEADTQALQSSKADATLLRWCLVDRRIACYSLVASIYLRRARRAFEEGRREDCLSGGVDVC